MSEKVRDHHPVRGKGCRGWRERKRRRGWEWWYGRNGCLSRNRGTLSLRRSLIINSYLHDLLLLVQPLPLSAAVHPPCSVANQGQANPASRILPLATAVANTPPFGRITNLFFMPLNKTRLTYLWLLPLNFGSLCPSSRFSLPFFVLPPLFSSLISLSFSVAFSSLSFSFFFPSFVLVRFLPFYSSVPRVFTTVRNRRLFATRASSFHSFETAVFAHSALAKGTSILSGTSHGPRQGYFTPSTSGRGNEFEFLSSFGISL